MPAPGSFYGPLRRGQPAQNPAFSFIRRRNRSWTPAQLSRVRANAAGDGLVVSRIIVSRRLNSTGSLVAELRPLLVGSLEPLQRIR